MKARTKPDFTTEPRSGARASRQRSGNGAVAEEERRGPKANAARSGEGEQPQKGQTRNNVRKAANVKPSDRGAGGTGRAERRGAGHGLQLRGSDISAWGNFGNNSADARGRHPPTRPKGGERRGWRRACPPCRCRGCASGAAAAALAPPALPSCPERLADRGRAPPAERSGAK